MHSFRQGEGSLTCLNVGIHIFELARSRQGSIPIGGLPMKKQDGRTKFQAPDWETDEFGSKFLKTLHLRVGRLLKQLSGFGREGIRVLHVSRRRATSLVDQTSSNHFVTTIGDVPRVRAKVMQGKSAVERAPSILQKEYHLLKPFAALESLVARPGKQGRQLKSVHGRGVGKRILSAFIHTIFTFTLGGQPPTEGLRQLQLE